MKRIVLTFFAIVSIVLGYAQDATKFKALFIYNFTKQIDWPAAEKTGDFVISIVGSNEMEAQLKTIVTGKKVGNQDIVLKKLKTVDEVTKCHILYLASSACSASNMTTVLSKLEGASTLIVTDRPGSLEKGACINFLIRAEKIKFELNKQALTDRKLQISTYLENMSASVE